MRILLQLIVDHWSDYWCTPRMEIPEPLPKNHPDGRKLGQASVTLRRENLEKAGQNYAVQPFPFQVDLVTNSPGERRLYASILYRAIADWATFSVRAFHSEQRQALQAYWWIMGYAPLGPAGLTDEQWLDIAAENQRPYRIPNGVLPFEFLGISRELLWELDTRKSPPVPSNEIEELFSLTSFRTCCDVLDLDPMLIRTRLHLVPPL